MCWARLVFSTSKKIARRLAGYGRSGSDEGTRSANSISGVVSGGSSGSGPDSMAGAVSVTRLRASGAWAIVGASVMTSRRGVEARRAGRRVRAAVARLGLGRFFGVAMKSSLSLHHGRERVRCHELTPADRHDAVDFADQSSA